MSLTPEQKARQNIDVFNDWRDNLEQIKREGKIVEAYIISGNTVSQMQI